MCNPPEQRICIAETGVGQEHCQQALSWLKEHGMSRETQVIGAGFAGALAPGWSVGDIILAREVIDEQSRRWPTTFSYIHPPPGGAGTGRLLSMNKLIGDPEEKKRLGREHRADAVDMESATAASFCAEFGLPFLAIRAISDDASTALSPRLMPLIGGSRVSLRCLLGAVIRSPAVVGELWRLARSTQKAAKRLADFLSPLIA